MHNFSITVRASAAVAQSSIASVIAVLMMAVSECGPRRDRRGAGPAGRWRSLESVQRDIITSRVDSRDAARSKCLYFGHSTIDISSSAVVVQNL
jgi:hypothetical protein